MIVLENIIALVFLFCSITTLPAGKDYKYKDDESTDDENGQMKHFDEVYGSDISEPGYTSRGGSLNLSRRWPNATIPYQIVGFSTEERELILKGMRTLEFWTCIQFTPFNENENPPDYIVIQNTPGMGCKAYRGRIGGGQAVYLESPRCVRRVGIVLHELLHAIGAIDQQRRPDRDSYITVNEQNVKADRLHSFSKIDERFIGNFGIPYDYHSVMHYPRYAESKNGLKTLVPKVPAVILGQRNGMSVRDAMLVMTMYNCSYTGFNVSSTDSFSHMLPNVAYDKENASKYSKEKLYEFYYMNISSTE